MTTPAQLAAQATLISTTPSTASSPAATPPKKLSILDTTLPSLEPFRAAYRAFKATGKVQRLNDVRISAAMATELLKIAGDNRSIVGPHLKKIESDMTEGRMATRIDPGIIDWAGTTRGGQHFLTAIKNTETTQIMDFRVGLDEASVKVAGDSKPWGAKDYIDRQVSDAPIKLSVARYELSYTAGRGLSKIALSNAHLLEYVAEHDAQLSIDIADMDFEGAQLRGLPKPLAITAFRRIVGAQLEMGGEVGKARADALKYFKELYGHEAIVLTDGPVFKVRDLITGAASGRKNYKLEGNGIRAQNNRLSLIFDGWNRWIVGENDTSIRLRRKFVEPIIA